MFKKKKTLRSVETSNYTQKGPKNSPFWQIAAHLKSAIVMDETMQQQQKLGIYRIVYRRGIERKTTVFVSEDDGKVLATKRLE